MRDEAAGGAEIAVTDEMRTAGCETHANCFGHDMDFGEAVSAVYRAMRALEPAQPARPSRLTVYDISKDETRPATQADIAMFEAVTQAYGELRRQVEGIQARLLAQCAHIRSKHGLPHEGNSR